MKKLFSMALALVMTMSLTIPAFADNIGAADDKTGSITIANEENAGGEYKAYKIFDVTYNGDNYSYTISTESVWYDVVSSFANWEKNGIKLVPAAGDSKTMVVYTDSEKFSAPDFAGYLRAQMSDTIAATGKDFEDGELTGLDLGYWFVTSNQGALCNLTTTDPDATIFDKNYVPFDKVDDDESVEVGQVVNYTITGEVPDTTGFDYYLYEITDTMSEGLTFNKDVVITFNNMLSLVADPSWCTYTENGFVLSMDLVTFFNNGDSIPAGWPITVTYSATVNEKAVSVVSKNSAVLKYSNDPANDTYTVRTPDEETVYSAKIVIDKYDSEDSETKLSGATFILQNAAGKYYKYADNKVTWVAIVDEATAYTTDNSGAASFIGLEDGSYKLIETVAPTGYNLLESPVDVTIAGSNTDITKLTIEADVENSTGALLPSTGGMGTTIFTVCGSVLMLGAAVLLVAKKKAGEE